jgi:DNA-binding NtrC family response regulator
LSKLSPLKKARVFVVDDPVVSSTIAEILRLRDFSVTTFSDGMNALKAARPIEPDLLIAEAVMAPCSGIDLAMLFQERLPDCKVLLFSGQWLSEALLQDARSRGLKFETIPKPVKPTELIQRVEDMTEGTSGSSAKNLALKTYKDNARETLSRLQTEFGKPKTGPAD